MKIWYCNFVVFAATLVSLSIAGSSYADTSLTFGVYTSDKPTEMVKQFRPILDSLEKKLGARLGSSVTIGLRVAPSYEEGIRRVVSGEVDFSQMGPAPYVLAKEQNPAIEILALESEKGKKEFEGIICVHAQSAITSVADLKGKSFAFGDRQSTIGRYLSQQLLMQHGIFAKDLARFEYLERHDAVGAAVGAGQFDAGALKGGAFKKLLEKKVPIKKLVVFRNITKPWVARAGLDKKIKDMVREELLGAKDPAPLEALGQDGFLVGDDDDFDSTRKAVKENHLF